MISSATRANLASYEGAADQQKPIHKTAIMKGFSPKCIKSELKHYTVDDRSKTRTAVCKVCCLKITDTTTTISYIHNERYVNVSFFKLTY